MALSLCLATPSQPHVRLAEALGTTGAAARDEAGGVVYDPEAAYKVLREGGAKAVRARLAAAEASKAAFDEAAEALARAVELSPNASGGEADAAVSRLRVARTAAAAAGVLESLWKEFEKVRRSTSLLSTFSGFLGTPPCNISKVHSSSLLSNKCSA